MTFPAQNSILRITTQRKNNACYVHCPTHNANALMLQHKHAYEIVRKNK
jgi:hypothetical protein